MNPPSPSVSANDPKQHLPRLALTAHASVRMRQRGIDDELLDCLLSYGRREHDHRGAEVVTHDRETLEQVRLFETAATWRAVEGAKALYAVVDSDGRVITAGHRFRRVTRDLSLSSMRPRRGRHLRGCRSPSTSLLRG